jgi:DNA-binding HxlR family transcriptional regulator
MNSVPAREPLCSVHRTLQVVGERWSMLIIREAFWGSTRFSQYRDTLGVSTDVLTDRLNTLVEHDVLAKQPYRADGSRERFSYHLTDSGRELALVLGSMMQWGDRNRPTECGPVAVLVERGTGEPVRAAFVNSVGEVVPTDEIQVLSTPAHPYR